MQHLHISCELLEHSKNQYAVITSDTASMENDNNNDIDHENGDVFLNSPISKFVEPIAEVEMKCIKSTPIENNVSTNLFFSGRIYIII